MSESIDENNRDALVTDLPPQTDCSDSFTASDTERLKAEAQNLSFWYGPVRALQQISLPIRQNQVTALIGPSGCGKSTFLRCFNRMHDLYANNRYEGSIRLYPSGVDLLGPDIDPIDVRMRISMVFQKPNPFPKSIYENVAYGLKIRGLRDKRMMDERIERSLRGAALWDETKDRLHKSAYDLSGGQQQRLCIARALAVDPEIVLFDEPTSALDPIATGKIEDLIQQLKDDVTIVIVTHNMQQAARVSDYTAFMYLGELIEVSPTRQMFVSPKSRLTEEYITGRFG